MDSNPIIDYTNNDDNRSQSSLRWPLAQIQKNIQE